MITNGQAAKQTPDKTSRNTRQGIRPTKNAALNRENNKPVIIAFRRGIITTSFTDITRTPSVLSAGGIISSGCFADTTSVVA
jgi:hypothetical protein